jgi:hypothetical protein
VRRAPARRSQSTSVFGNETTRKGATAVIDATTVTCPGCKAAVSVAADASSAVCAQCGRSFSPWGLPTVAPQTPAGSAPLSDAAAEPDPLVGRTLGGRRLVRVIGRGGMGAVYEALDDAHGRVAVKVLPQALSSDASFVSRFHREAKVLAGLSHPHIVEVLDRGQDGDRFWFAMEYVRGESLRRPLERGPMPWREASRVASEVLSALSYAHGRGVVHRDLKPENVLLSADGRVRLVDFGLSRIVRGEAAVETARLTRTNVILGTYEYMAPEQRTGSADVDERADLYAVGVILYEMLTGALPIGRFDAPSALRPGCPASLDGVVHRALASAPKDRFPSAVAFREALDAAVASTDASPAASQAPGAGWGAAAAAVFPPMPDAGQRKVLRHVEIVAAGDRVLAVILALTGAGLFTLFRSVAASGTVVCWIGAYLLWKQGARLRDLAPGSREAQVTASILAGILFFPLGTVLGVYGLITLTGEDARRVFRERDRTYSGFARGGSVAAPPPPPPPPPPIDAEWERRWPGRAAEMRFGRKRRPGRGRFWFLALLVLVAGVVAASGISGHPVGMVVLAPVAMIGLILLAFRMSVVVAVLLALGAAVLLLRGGRASDYVPPFAQSHEDRRGRDDRFDDRFDDRNYDRSPRGPRTRLPEPRPVPAMGG